MHLNPPAEFAQKGDISRAECARPGHSNFRTYLRDKDFAPGDRNVAAAEDGLRYPTEPPHKTLKKRFFHWAPCDKIVQKIERLIEATDIAN